MGLPEGLRLQRNAARGNSIKAGRLHAVSASLRTGGEVPGEQQARRPAKDRHDASRSRAANVAARIQHQEHIGEAAQQEQSMVQPRYVLVETFDAGSLRLTCNGCTAIRVTALKIFCDQLEVPE